MTTKGGMAWLLLTPALLAACAVGPDYIRPEVAIPATYKEATQVEAVWRPALPTDAPNPQDPEHWWEIFQDPLLNALELEASQANWNIQAAEARYRQAQAQVQEARATLFPALSGKVETTRNQGAASGTGRTPAPVTTHNLAINTTWEPDLWGKIGRSVEAGEANAQASAADLTTARLNVQASLAQNFFLIRMADAQQKLLDQTVAGYTKSLRITQNQYQAGLAPRSDLLQAETQLKNTQAQALDVGIQRRQLEHAMAILLGKPPAAFAIVPRSEAIALPEFPAGVPSGLLERRPDIAAAERRMAAANAKIGVAEAAFFPDLTLAASAGLVGHHWADWLSIPNRIWSVGSSVAQSLFDAGLRQAQSDQAIAAHEAAVANYRQTILQGFQEVEDNLAALAILAQESKVQAEAVRAVRQLVTLTTNQYQEGTVGYLNVVTAQATALATERSALEILSRRLTASVQLIKALGGGWR